MKAIVQPRQQLNGEISVPGSKSHTIRAVVISALAQGESTIRNPLASADGISAAKVMSQFGAQVELGDGVWKISGTGSKLALPNDVVNVGNSGTTLYFAASIASTIPGWTVFTGDASIRSRPINELLGVLRSLGAKAHTTRPVNAPPVIIEGPIRAGDAHFQGTFSQYISGLLLAAPLIEGKLHIRVENARERPYLKMTVDWMRQQGIDLKYDDQNFSWFEVVGPQIYKPVNTVIPADWESVAFPLAAGIICGNTVTITGLDFSYSQGDQRLVDIFREMGAHLQTNEGLGTLTITGPTKLRGMEIDCADIPDAMPILAVAASFASGQTVLTGLEMVRAKETDRVAVMESQLTKMGVSVESGQDYLKINGNLVKGAEVDSFGDHRIAMALVVAGLGAAGYTTVNQAESVEVSFPSFFTVMSALGARIQLVN